MTAREVLDGIKTRLEPALFHAPYVVDGRRVVQANNHPDLLPYVLSDNSVPAIADFIAAAPVDVARLTRAVEAVLELHVPVMEDGEPAGCSCCDWESEGNWGWPCATLAAIENALNP